GRAPVFSFEIDLVSIQNDLERNIGAIPFSGTLVRGESAFLSYNWVDAPSGRTAVVLRIDLPGDQRPENNADTVHVVRQFEPNDVVINEIMFEPLNGQNEWLEVVNRTEKGVDLAGWQIRDLPTPSGSTNRFTIGGSNSLLEPGGFKVLVAESTIYSLFPNIDTSSVILFRQSGGFSFGNDGDAVILTDLSGAVIDSLVYSPSWHHPKVKDTRGRSLERIRPDLVTNDPRNWSTTADPAGGSPGIRNSIFTAGSSSTSSLSFSPNPFSPDNDGHEDYCAVRFEIPIPSSVVRIRIFDLGGRLIRTLADGETFGPQGEVIWDGMESGGRKARIGPHIVLLEASGADGSVFSARGVVVVAARL
ncbi:MAG TPA: lamin tail domain-containing protein, partial [Bacteroidota bacterium]